LGQQGKGLRAATGAQDPQRAAQQKALAQRLVNALVDSRVLVRDQNGPGRFCSASPGAKPGETAGVVFAFAVQHENGASCSLRVPPRGVAQARQQTGFWLKNRDP
jgi:hypothetical protein